jgi:hypothetical protein
MRVARPPSRRKLFEVENSVLAHLLTCPLADLDTLRSLESDFHTIV